MHSWDLNPGPDLQAHGLGRDHCVAGLALRSYSLGSVL